MGVLFVDDGPQFKHEETPYPSEVGRGQTPSKQLQHKRSLDEALLKRGPRKLLFIGTQTAPMSPGTSPRSLSPAQIL